MSIDPGNKPSLLAAFADEYELEDADADRLIARIQTSVAQDAAAGSSSPSPSLSAARGSGVGKSLLLVGASCLALATAGAAVLYTLSKTDPASAKATSGPPVPAQTNEQPHREAESTTAPPSITVESLPSVAPASPSQGNDAKKAPVVSTSSSAAAPGAASADTLGRETQLLTSARAAVKGGNPDKALALLDEHARLFPNGWLANDRVAERIVVLCGVGRRAEAVREAKAFLDGRPKSPLTRRVEASCAVDSPTKATE
ncbi:MAG: hypothetical protein BGO98_30625 [Myxococcales bacterium 68-20]|nr:hypothetical protein [Myxococcales bacterium]OJY16439.1 MAG: hypothetical protein BGO98_30625 [Myxococcales bacterium 68-20]